DVGLVLSKRSGYIGVVSALPGSPAAQSGVAAGDFIETIKGVATRDMPLAYAEMILKGDPGSPVEISLFKARRPDPQKVTLTRAVLNYPALRSEMMPDQIGYIRPETMSASKVKDIAEAVKNLQQQGAKRIVLDLRNCAIGGDREGLAV